LAWAEVVRPFGARFGISSARTPPVQQKVWDMLIPQVGEGGEFKLPPPSVAAATEGPGGEGVELGTVSLSEQHWG